MRESGEDDAKEPPEADGAAAEKPEREKDKGEGGKGKGTKGGKGGDGKGKVVATGTKEQKDRIATLEGYILDGCTLAPARAAELAALKVSCEKIVEETPAVQLAKITAKQKVVTEAQRKLEGAKKRLAEAESQIASIRTEVETARTSAETLDQELEILQARYDATRKRPPPTAEDEGEIDDRTKELFEEL